MKNNLSNRSKISEDAKDYLKNNITFYILNRIFPQKKYFYQFYYDRKEFTDNLSSLKTARSKDLAENLYDSTELGLRNRSFGQRRSNIGKIKEFFAIVTSEISFKAFIKQLSGNLQINARIAIYAMPIIIGLLVAPTATAFLPLIAASTALVFVVTSIFLSYSLVKSDKKNEIIAISKNFKYEAKLYKQQTACLEYEKRSGITDLLDFLMNKEILLSLKKSQNKEVGEQLDKLFMRIKNKKEVSQISKQVLSAIGEIAHDYSGNWQKGLDKIPYREKQLFQPNMGIKDIEEKVFNKISKINEHFDKSKSITRNNDLNKTQKIKNVNMKNSAKSPASNKKLGKVLETNKIDLPSTRKSRFNKKLKQIHSMGSHKGK